MPPVNIDLPDYQRGVASAQVLLATEAPSTNHVIVGVPPNAETLVVVVAASPAQVPVAVTGLTSGMNYPGYAVTSGSLAFTNDFVWMFDISNVIDEQAEVQLFGTPPSTWYVYADTGPHVMVDAANLRNQHGQLYVIPTVPATDTQDHPPNELAFLSNEANASGVVFGSPGAGKRYRLFGAWLTSISGGGSGFLVDSVSGSTILSVGSNVCIAQTFLPSGLPLGTNGSINWTLGAAGNVVMGITFTTETV